MDQREPRSVAISLQRALGALVRPPLLAVIIGALFFCSDLPALAFPALPGSGSDAVAPASEGSTLLARRRRRRRKRPRRRRKRSRRAKKTPRKIQKPKSASDAPNFPTRRRATAAAAPAAPAASGALRRGARVEFDGRLVQGQTAKSGAIYLFARKRSDLRSMVKERESYRKEILRTVYPSYGKKK